MHTSDKVDVYVDITSNPIIEHCKNIRFAKYPAKYGSGSQVCAVDCVSRLPPLHNLQGNNPEPQDFSHIKASPSPNWTFVSSTEDIDWPSLESLGTTNIEDILQKLLPV